jgi:hypothetical protein
MDIAISQVEINNDSEISSDEAISLSADELLLIGGGQCITNSI